MIAMAMAASPCSGQFVLGLFIGAGLVGVAEVATLLWQSRSRTVSIFRNYRVICRDCKSPSNER